MSLNRREFMWACGGTVAALALGAGPARGGLTAERKIWMIPDLTKELFDGYVGETFLVGPDQGPGVPLKLAKVVETPKEGRVDQKGNIRTESFSLIFEGTPESALAQGIHTFKHDKMGEATLFAVPIVSRVPGVRSYEVVFNRLVNS